MLMKTAPLVCLVAGSIALGLCCVGCQPGGGFLITPVPERQDLEEKPLAPDPGWGVRDKIALIDLDGLIVNEQRGRLFERRENPVAFFVEKLQKAEADEQVRAVVLRINSPGGSVTASDICHRELAAFRRRSGKPVVVAMMDTAASGGFYIAQAADHVLAHPTTVTGSIGAVFVTFSLEGLLTKIGVKTEAIKSGPNKDMASPLRDLTPDARKILEELIAEYHKRFVDIVAARHPNLPRERLEQLADGRVYTGRQARRLGLVDQVGYVPEAIAEAARRAGVDRFRVVAYHRPLGWKQNVYSAAPLGGQFNMINVDLKGALSPGEPVFMYLWTPDVP
jgi:protease-4